MTADEVEEEIKGLAETTGGSAAFVALDTGIWDDTEEEEDRHHDAGVVGFTPRQFTYDCCICSVS